MPTTSDKPQTLAEQIRVKKIECVSIESGFEERADPIWRIELNGYCADFEYQTAAENFAEQIRAALADAAEQAGDVRQSWRVKPLVWHNFDAWTWWAESTSGTYRVEERNGVWRATLNLPMTEHVIYEYETDGTPNDFEAAHLACQADHTARITSALEPYHTHALGWRAMQTAALKAIDPGHGDFHAGDYNAVAALPGPSDEQALAEAMKLPQWQEMRALVDAVRAFKEAQAEYSALPSDRGRMAGPKGTALTKALLCEGAMFAALAKIGGAA